MYTPSTCHGSLIHLFSTAPGSAASGAVLQAGPAMIFAAAETVTLDPVARAQVHGYPELAANITPSWGVKLIGVSTVRAGVVQSLNWSIQSAAANAVAWAILAIKPPQGGWIDDQASPLVDAFIQLVLTTSCSLFPTTMGSSSDVVVIIPVPGVPRQFAEAVSTAGGYSQLVSGLSGGTSSGTALGRAIATRSIALCDADGAVVSGVIDVGAVVCSGGDRTIAARNTIVSNVALIGVVAACAGLAVVAWRLLCRDATLAGAALVLRLPSSLLPIFAAALPSTAASATYLLARLGSSPCVGIDVVLALAASWCQLLLLSSSRCCGIAPAAVDKRRWCA
jgi:hypothetical protein